MLSKCRVFATKLPESYLQCKVIYFCSDLHCYNSYSAINTDTRVGTVSFGYISEDAPSAGSLHDAPQTKVGMLRDRFLLVQQRLQRNEMFCKPLIASTNRDYIEVSIWNLLPKSFCFHLVKKLLSWVSFAVEYYRYTSGKPRWCKMASWNAVRGRGRLLLPRRP